LKEIKTIFTTTSPKYTFHEYLITESMAQDFFFNTTFAYPVKKFSFYGKQRLVITFTRARHWSVF
jgi:hypothetical protein